MPPFLQLEYPITRPFQWKWFTPLVIGFSCLVLAFLIPLNLALNGYQIVIMQSTDFNTVGNKHWFHRFVNPPEPGTLCDPHNFTLGDTLITSYTLFQWIVLSPNVTDPLAISVSYTGTNLDACDIWGISIDANVQTSSVQASLVVLCKSRELPVVLQGVYTYTGGDSGSYVVNYLRLNIQNVFDLPQDLVTAGSLGQAYTGVGVANALLDLACGDLAMHLQEIRSNSSLSAPYIFSVAAIPEFCPKTMLSTANSNCSSDAMFMPPEFVFTWIQAAHEGAKATEQALLDDIAIAETLYQTSVSNLVQTLHAAVRLDLGYILPNNFFTNASASVIAATIAPNFTSDSQVPSMLYTSLLDPVGAGISYPIVGTDEGFINTSYPCRFTIPRTPTQIFLSVVVATISVFGGGWTVFMALAAIVAKLRSPNANNCIRHSTDQRPTYTQVSTSEYSLVPLERRGSELSGFNPMKEYPKFSV